MPSEKISFDYLSLEHLQIKFIGDWRISAGLLPSVDEVITELSRHREIIQVSFDASKIAAWDSGWVSFLFHIIRECEHRKINVIHKGLPEGAEKMLMLALKINQKDIPRKEDEGSFLVRVADATLRLNEGLFALLNFLGEVAVSFGQLITGRLYFRRDDFINIVQKCGADALPLVSLISALVGMILAFIGAIQLKLFGAQIFIADIVGIAMVRVMGAVMTGVLMSGRTGASFAAELGLMQTNEEIDALKTLGISPVGFLVLPRIIALVVMMPLLTLYANLMGIVGGYVISVTILGLNPIEYLNHTHSAVKIGHLWVGLVHSFVFGIIIAITGCLRGMQCRRSASGVGEATTSAVVSAITCIVIATAIITFVCQILGV